MKKITARQLAMSYTGVFLGAGFVSGQELWQFFACFGPIGLLGFLGTAALFFYVNYANLRLIQVTGVEDMGRLMTWGEGNKLRSLVTFMQCLLLFGVTIIMIAGAASLLNQLLGIPGWMAGLGFTVLVSLIALLGMQGLVAVFSMLATSASREARRPRALLTEIRRPSLSTCRTGLMLSMEPTTATVLDNRPPRCRKCRSSNVNQWQMLSRMSLTSDR